MLYGNVFLLVIVGIVHCSMCVSKLAQPTLVSGKNQPNQAMQYLQSELLSCTRVQQAIQVSLLTKGVHLNSHHIDDKHSSRIPGDDMSRITVSTFENNIDCRIALGKAPEGSKCVAPCGCTGSQKWVQFSELNRLRRKDPLQWKTCRTCQRKFDYELFTPYGGLKANIIGYALDHRVTIRTIGGVLSLFVVYASSLPLLVSRILTSHFFWQQVRTSKHV